MPTVSLPIIDALLNPALVQLKETDEGVHGPGPLDITLSIPGALGSTAYGCRVSVVTLPASWGRILGNPDVLVPAYGQLALSATLGDGNNVVTEVDQLVFDGQIKRWGWTISPLGVTQNFELLVHVEPFVTIHLRWLTVN